MVAVHPVDLAGDRECVVDFMTSSTFPFHAGGRPSRAQALRRLDVEGWDHAWWVLGEGRGRVGIARLDDVGSEIDADETPLFDLRLGEEARGCGVGRHALRALTARVFTAFPVRRFEGCTREDNVAMRRVFEHCGWVKEAHHREAWPVPGSAPLDAVTYAILRRDWASGSTTPVRFDDLS